MQICNQIILVEGREKGERHFRTEFSLHSKLLSSVCGFQRQFSLEMDEAFDPNLVHAIFKLIWRRKALERERIEGTENIDPEGGPGSSKKNRPTSAANANAVKLSAELLRLFITEAIQRAAAVAEAEGVCQIEGTHLERILPQLLLDF